MAATSFFVYVGLGLGFLASTLSLPFGVFVLICQREPLRYIQVMQAFVIPARSTSYVCPRMQLPVQSQVLAFRFP